MGEERVNEKEKKKDDGTLIVKHRLILDCKASESNDAADVRQRVVLPRITDAVDDSLALLWQVH